MADNDNKTNSDLNVPTPAFGVKQTREIEVGGIGATGPTGATGATGSTAESDKLPDDGSELDVQNDLA